MSDKVAFGKLRETRSEIEVEWKIFNFSSLSEEMDECYDCATFPFSDSLWYLRIYPNGEKEHQSDGWVGLYLRKHEMEPDRTMSFKIAIKKADDRLEGPIESKRIFDGKNVGWGRAKYLEKSKLTERKSEFMPSDVLTITCTVKNDVSRLAGASLFGRIFSVSRNLKEILTGGKRSDVVLNVSGREIKAHRTILETRSTVFSAMFGHDMVENRTGVVTIGDTDPDVLEQVLCYMYSGQVEKMSPVNVCQIYVAADKYDLDELKDACSTYMEENISMDIVCDVVVIADMYKVPKLRDLSRQFFLENSVEILKTKHWEKLASENHAIAIQLLASIVVDTVSKDK